MNKLFALIQIIVGLTANFMFSQVGVSQDTSKDTIARFTIKPSTTDSSIKIADSEHLILYSPSIKQGKLLLFLPGTNGIPERGPLKLFKTAIEQGYRVINLSYINKQAVAGICRGSTLVNDSSCTEKFRTKRIYGDDLLSLIPDEPQDAIINRFTKLLLYLVDYDKQGNWGMYLENDELKWDQIAVSGQSQGGGMAAFIAKRQLVDKVITFSGGWDYAAKDKIAEWYFQKSITPPERWYGTYHVDEPKALTIEKTYQAMAIPAHQIYPLNLEVQEGRKAHGQAIRNTAYKQLWLEILGVGN